MQYYYLVPTYNEHTFLNGIRFDKMLEKCFQEIYSLEKRKVELYNQIEDEYDSYNNVCKKIECLYRTFHIPEYIICIEENGSYYELLTNAKVLSNDLADFECYEVNFNLASEYYNYSNYNECFSNYYSSYLLCNYNPLVKKLKYNIK